MTPSSTPSTPSGLFGLTLEGLRDRLAAWGEQPYRATQILEWAYGRGATSYDEMTNLSKALRARLIAELPLYTSSIVGCEASRDGTVKLLLAWPDGATSECVMIPEGARRTVCLSTQVGCAVGCVFCASGLNGLQRSLSAGEMVEQVMRAGQRCAAGERVSNVVFMGLGEPLANYDATLSAVRTINAAWGLHIGARKITISTVGLPKMIRRLAGEGLQITLALSLHAPTDELRHRLIPSAGRVTIESLIEAAHDYFERTGREITLEYVLLAGVNDSEQAARALAAVARKTRANVNLLTYNPVEGLPFRRPEKRDAERFLGALRAAGINAHLRPGRGLDIDAACGQLRRRAAASGAPSGEPVGPASDEPGRAPEDPDQ
jgi:23S rRNA (adenine2503-C2)-methyltransferase